MEGKILKALCEPRRFLLLQLMAERAFCVRALAKRSGLTESAVSQHLKVLREAGLVTGIKRGYYTHYEVCREALNAVIAAFTSLRDAERLPCDRPFYGCPEAEAVGCPTFVPLSERNKENTGC